MVTLPQKVEVLNSERNKLGLHGSQEVVLQGRLRGGGYSGGGKGARGGGGNSVAAGDWTCGICHQSGCWNAKSTCYRCGAPRHQSQGLSGQANSGARDMEGRYQSGVGTGMGGYRVIGPNGRDQSSIPGGNPTQRKGPQPGGKGRNKVGGDTGAGVGVGFGIGGGVVGGGGGGDNRSAFSWLGGGGGVGNPLPPGIVLSERDQALFCVEHLKGLLKVERDLEEFSNFWEERLPAKPVPAPVKTPTEAQRAEVFAQLTKKQDGLARRVKDGQGRVEVAKAKVRQEEAAVEELERELKMVSDQVDAHRAENLRRAEEAKAPRVDEVGSDMDLEAGSSSGGEFGVNQVAGKRRKVVRKNRFQGTKLTKEELWQFFNGMPNPDRDWFKRQFLGDVGSGVGCTDHTLAGDVVEPDKVELNARASLAPTRRNWLKRHVGRCQGNGGKESAKEFFQGSGAQENSKVFKPKTKVNKVARVFKSFNFEEQSTIFTVSAPRSNGVDEEAGGFDGGIETEFEFGQQLAGAHEDAGPGLAVNTGVRS